MVVLLDMLMMKEKGEGLYEFPLCLGLFIPYTVFWWSFFLSVTKLASFFFFYLFQLFACT